MKSSEKFWDRIAYRYDAQDVANRAAHDRALELARGYLRADDRALDFGCGTGTVALALCDGVKSIEAIDISEKMVTIARDHAAVQGVESVHFSQMSITDAALSPGSYNAILAFNVIHLVDDSACLIQRFSELLRPGGVVISVTPCLAGKWWLVTFLLRTLSRFGIVPWVNSLGLKTIEGLLQEADFEIISIERLEHTPPSYFVAARKSP